MRFISHPFDVKGHGYVKWRVAVILLPGYRLSCTCGTHKHLTHCRHYFIGVVNHNVSNFYHVQGVKVYHSSHSCTYRSCTAVL